ncbi:MAG: hypothetical protein IPK10_20090 [Bacteroidetes bacterium]|nr:hypothetical protein [Bacteroidota bacterium]
MKVYLLHDDLIEENLYFGIVEFLQKSPGPYQFIPDMDRTEIDINDEIKTTNSSSNDFHIQHSKMLMEYNSINSIQQLSWKDLIETCRKFRKKWYKRRGHHHSTYKLWKS